MTRHVAIFLLTFALGAVIAVILRTANHRPYDEHDGHPAPSAATPMAMPESAPAALPTTTAAPAPTPPAPAHSEPEHHHADAEAAGPTTVKPAATPVNTICPGCGNPVDPAIPTATYKGKTIGFNCAMCPPKFAAEPEKYGEAALKNQAAE